MLIPPCLLSFPERKVGSTCFNSFHGWSIGKKTEMKLKKKKKSKRGPLPSFWEKQRASSFSSISLVFLYD
jgi:hypothetical protein